MIIENGIKYETKLVVVQEYQAAVEAVEAVPGKPGKAPVEHKDAVLDENGNVITPEVMAEQGYDAVAEIPAIEAKAEVQEVKEEQKTGLICGIEVQVDGDANISVPHVRKIEMLSITEEVDLEIIVQARINYYASDGTTRLSDWIDGLDISPDAKAIRKQMYQSFVIAPKSTRNSWINPVTGELVAKGTEGAITELQFYQNIKRVDLVAMGVVIDTAERRQQVLRYQMIKFMLLTIFQRAGI